MKKRHLKLPLDCGLSSPALFVSICISHLQIAVLVVGFDHSLSSQVQAAELTQKDDFQ